MILTDREIKIAISGASIIIDPKPNDDAFSSTSLDLTLDNEITEFIQEPGGIEKIIDPTHEDYRYDTVAAAIATSVKMDGVNGYVLRPQPLVLGWTAEYVDLKYHSRLAARVEGKSSLARLGLCVHLTAPTIHAGFQGRIRLEMVNHGYLPIGLRPGMRVCQLIFEQTLGTPDRGYQGQFLGQKVSLL